MLGASELAYILDHSGATAMVAEDMLLPLAEAGIEAAGRERLVTVRGVIGDAWSPAGSPWRTGPRTTTRPSRRSS